MNPAQRTALAVALAAIGVALGIEFAVHLKPHDLPAVRTPAGQASQPLIDDAADLTPGLQSATKIPALLPKFTLHDVQGKAVSIDQWRGKSLMVNFWATWCAPCRQEIPLLQAIHTEQAAHGTEVIGVAVDYPDKVGQFAHALGITYPLLVGEQDALDLATRLGVSAPAFPFTVFTDKRGAIVSLYMGALKRADVDQMLHIIDRLNQNQLDLPTAQREIAARLAVDQGV